MNIWRSLEGQVEVELLTADSSGALDAIARADIPLTRIFPEKELTISFQIQRSQLGKLSKLVKKRGEKLTVLRNIGLYFHLRRFFHRRLLSVGLALLTVITLLLPTRIYFFQVSGNVRIPAGRILTEAENQGLCFGISRREVRSEKIKNGLLAAIPELKWVGVNTYGCVAQIMVAEKSPQPEASLTNSGVGHLVSCLDGIVTNVTVTSGTALCHPGQAVSKGQTLISGLVDCGIVQKGIAAQGEVTAVTERKLSVITPGNRLMRGGIQKQGRRWSLLLGKKRIKLWIGSGIWDARCGRIYKEYPLTLPGGFRLPVALAAEELTWSAASEEAVPEAQAHAQMSAYAEGYLRAAMLAGTIRQRQENLTQGGSCFRLTGTYLCQEVISRRQWEQTGDTNE